MAGNISPDGRSAATACGAGAIGLWSLLALLTSQAGRLPPFEMTAITFGIGTVLLNLLNIARGRGAAGWRQPWRTVLAGVAGLFAYHALYFLALTSAPPAEASLICYLWPLLIVVGAGLLPGGRLRPLQVAGAVLGLAGVGLLALGKVDFSGSRLPGYIAAFCAALVWAGYSLGLRRFFAGVPSDIIASQTAGTAVLAALCHAAFETWTPPDAEGWIGLGLLGLGPVGAAFALWDVGMKRGDAGLLGAFSYAAPLLSTLLLVLLNRAAGSWTLAAACAAVTAGAALAALAVPRPSAAA